MIVLVYLIYDKVQLIHSNATVTFYRAKERSKLIIIKKTVMIKIKRLIQIINTRAVTFNCVPKKTEFMLG